MRVIKCGESYGGMKAAKKVHTHFNPWSHSFICAVLSCSSCSDVSQKHHTIQIDPKNEARFDLIISEVISLKRFQGLQKSRNLTFRLQKKEFALFVYTVEQHVSSFKCWRLPFRTLLCLSLHVVFNTSDWREDTSCIDNQGNAEIKSSMILA